MPSRAQLRVKPQWRALFACGVAGVVGVVLVTAPPAAASSFDSTGYSVDINTIYSRSEGGNLGGFGFAGYRLDAFGPNLLLGGSGRQTWGGAVPLSVTAVTTTEVVVKCNLEKSGSFKDSGSGADQVDVAFYDGAKATVNNPLGAIFSAGTGYSRATAAILATGDLSYPLAFGNGAAIAESGDDPSNLQVTIPIYQGAQGQFTPNVGHGPESATGSGADVKTITGASTTFKLQAFVSANIRDDDSLIGAALSTFSGSATQRASVQGQPCKNELVNSTLDMSIKDAVLPFQGTATIHVVTKRNDTGAVVEDTTKTLNEDDAAYEADNQAVTTNTGAWNAAGSHTWKARAVASASGRIGVQPGARSTYLIQGSHYAARRVTFRVQSASGNGGVILSASGRRVQTPGTERSTLVTNPLTGRGDARALLIPRNLKLGDTVPGIGRVSAVDRNTTVVRVSLQGAHGTGRYDARTGWLQRLTLHGGGDKASIRKLG